LTRSTLLTSISGAVPVHVRGSPADLRSPSPHPDPISMTHPLLLRALLVAVLAAVCLGTPASSVGALQEFESEDRYRVFLLTMDQGEEVWELFGHNALVIRNESTGEELAWNWGLFDFGDVDFIPRFLRGTMLYSMGPTEVQPFLQAYARAGRRVYSNEVHLSQEEARELDEFVRWNYQPENRDYVYDYFRDNCSTRIRDALDRVLGGAIYERYADRPARWTYREQSRQLVQIVGWVDQGLSFLLGTRGDHPRTQWEAMFVPMRLMELLEEMEVEEVDGSTRPLLGPREVVVDIPPPPTPLEPPSFSWIWLLLGLLGAAGLGIAGLALRRGRTGVRWAVGAVAVSWGLVTGVLGVLLVASWFTDHVFIHRNVNILYASPLALILALALLPGLVRRVWWEGWPGRVTRVLAVVIAAGSVVGILLQLTTLVRQGNAEVVALALPINLALAWALLTAGRAATSDAPPSSETPPDTSR